MIYRRAKNPRPFDRERAPQRWPSDRAGVEFLNDAGDEGACITAIDQLEPWNRVIQCRQRNAQGWGGSGREGKGYPQFRLSVSVAAVGFAENGSGLVAPSVPRLGR